MSSHLMKTIAVGMFVPEYVPVERKHMSDVKSDLQRKEEAERLKLFLKPRGSQTRIEGTGQTLLTGQTGATGQPRVYSPTLLGG